MRRLSIVWPPICQVCGQPILNFDTAVVVLSEDAGLSETERARFAVHGFCITEAPPLCMDLRDFAKLVQRLERNERFG